MSAKDTVWALFDVEPLWCLDTNVVVSFLKEDDEEPYSRLLLPEQWRAFEADIATGLIISPPQVRTELEQGRAFVPDLGRWLATHQGMFRDLDDSAMTWAKKVVNAYPAYGKDMNYLSDLCVIALAGATGLTVISNERSAKGQPSAQRPKMPDVCAHFDIGCVTVIGYLRRRTSGESAPQVIGDALLPASPDIE